MKGELHRHFAPVQLAFFTCTNIGGNRACGLAYAPRFSVKTAVVDSRFLKRPVRMRMPRFM